MHLANAQWIMELLHCHRRRMTTHARPSRRASSIIHNQAASLMMRRSHSVHVHVDVYFARTRSHSRGKDISAGPAAGCAGTPPGPWRPSDWRIWTVGDEPLLVHGDRGTGEYGPWVTTWDDAEEPAVRAGAEPVAQCALLRRTSRISAHLVMSFHIADDCNGQRACGRDLTRLKCGLRGIGPEVAWSASCLQSCDHAASETKRDASSLCAIRVLDLVARA